jgi:hydrogenase maturation protease
MNSAIIDAITKAALYEGYMLYPYRPSAIKNRQRFNFGVLYPRPYSEAQGDTDAWRMQTQCLVLGSDETRCVVRVRFLRMVARSIGKLTTPTDDLPNLDGLDLERVDRYEAGGRGYQPWLEAVEDEVEVAEIALSGLLSGPMQWPFRMPGKRDAEGIREENGKIGAVVLREQEPLMGLIEVSAERVQEGLFRISVEILNATSLDAPVAREEALTRSLVSTHTILEARDGEFVSLIDPPENLREFVTGCHNTGTWPVLVGEEGQRDIMLSSPIILYDYPQVAAESPGDLFDGAEIDEILSLRIMTMTEDEKREMRESDGMARQILERTDALPEEHLKKLHGAVRGLRPTRGEMP